MGPGAHGKGRAAIVTGAGTGIGRAIAVALAEVGIRCTVVGRRAGPLEETIALAPAGSSMRAMSGDITSAADRERIVEAVVAADGRLDILVNNAGISAIEPLLEQREASWHEVMATNVDAAFFMAQAVLPHMRGQRWGRIVNIGSVFGSLTLNPDLYEAFPFDDERGPTRQPAYHTSKGALLNLTRDLAGAVARWNVTVNAVSPGMVLTDQSRDLLSDEVKRKLTDMTPLHRLGEPHEIAAAVRFLVSDEAAFITGEELRVDGGWTIW